MALAVNQAFGATDTASDTVTTGAVTTVAGSTLVVVGHYYASTGPAAGGDVTDSKGNTYTLFPGSDNVPGGAAPGIAVYYNIGGVRGASHTITVNSPGSGIASASVLEFTGNGVPNLATVGVASDATTPFSVTPASDVQPAQLAIYGVTLDGGTLSTWTAPTGFTNIFNEPDGTARLIVESAYKLLHSGSAAVGATRGGTIAAGREVIVTFAEVVAPPLDFWTGHPDLGPNPGFGPNPFDEDEPPPTISAGSAVFPIAVDAALTLNAAIIRTVNRNVASALTLVPTIVRVVNRTKALALTLTAAVSRQVNRNVALALSLPVSVSRVVQRPISTGLTLNAAVVASRILSRPISVALTLNANVTRVVNRPLSTALTLVPTAARVVNRNLALALTLNTALLRVVQRNVSTALTLVAAVVRVVQRPVSTALTLVASVSLTRILSRAISTALTLNAAVSRNVNRNVASVLTLVPSISRGVLRNIATALTLQPAVTRVVQRTITTPLALTAAVTRVVARTVALPLTLTAAVNRRINRSVNAALTLVANVVADRIGGGTIYPVAVDVTLTLQAAVTSRVVIVIGAAGQAKKWFTSKFGIY